MEKNIYLYFEAYDKVFLSATNVSVEEEKVDELTVEERREVIQKSFQNCKKLAARHQTVRAMFAVWDKDVSGSISRKEFAKALSSLGVAPNKKNLSFYAIF